ncbi:MAG: hypothetical protein U1D30_02050 [Planctomycetota bacterium]
MMASRNPESHLSSMLPKSKLYRRSSAWQSSSAGGAEQAALVKEKRGLFLGG